MKQRPSNRAHIRSTTASTATTTTELPRITGSLVELPRIAGGMESPAPQLPELSIQARIDPLGGGAEVIAGARTRTGVVAVSCVLIVFFIVAGVVLIATSDTRRDQPRREGMGSCMERIQHTEVIVRTCARGGS